MTPVQQVHDDLRREFGAAAVHEAEAALDHHRTSPMRELIDEQSGASFYVREPVARVLMARPRYRRGGRRVFTVPEFDWGAL